MRENKLTIEIYRPASEVFWFTVNPKNTPKWVEGVVEEQSEDWPPKADTIYRNRGEEGGWDEFKVSQLEDDKVFELSSLSDSYHVRYTYTPIGENQTELEYYEWVEKGEIKNPFTQATLEKLKSILER